MHTMEQYIHWMEKVRNKDPTGEKLAQFQKDLRNGLGEEAVTAEQRELFLPPNPLYTIQPFDNGSGKLISQIETKFLQEHLVQKGFTEEGSYENNSTRTKCYGKGTGDTIYIHEEKQRNSVATIRAQIEDNSYRHHFTNPTGIVICTYRHGNLRRAHDWAQPLLELIDQNEISSAVIDRRANAGASNITQKKWMMISDK